MKQRNLIYIAIAVVCVIALVIGIIYEVSKNNKKPENVIEQPKPKVEEKLDLDQSRQEFYDLFDNSFYSQGNNIKNVKKIHGLEHEDYIYAAYTIEQEVEGKYKININLPVFNIIGDEAAKINQTTQEIFANKASDIITNSKTYTVYDIDYVAFQNGNIISLLIKATLKETDHPQRIIVQTYNYDIVNDKQVSLNEALKLYNISQSDANKKIDTIVKEAIKQAKSEAESTGLFIYERDINNAMYVTDNANYFFIGLDGQVYVIYPYGNSNYTSELDIIEI